MRNEESLPQGPARAELVDGATDEKNDDTAQQGADGEGERN